MLTKHILLADDDIDDVLLLCETIKQRSPEVEVTMYENGKQVLDNLNRPTAPDIFIFDLNMPVVDGKECIKAVRKIDKLRYVPIVVYSTSSNEKDIQECMELGADYYIVKPAKDADLQKVGESLTTGSLRSFLRY